MICSYPKIALFYISLIRGLSQSCRLRFTHKEEKKKNNYEAETRALSKLPSKHGFDLRAGVDTTIHLVGNRVRQALLSPSVHTANGQRCLVYSMRS